MRHAVLDCLVWRHPTALSVAGIRRRVATEVGFAPETIAVEAALAILAGMNPALAESAADELGATAYWRATAAGVLFVERKGS